MIARFARDIVFLALAILAAGILGGVIFGSFVYATSTPLSKFGNASWWKAVQLFSSAGVLIAAVLFCPLYSFLGVLKFRKLWIYLMVAACAAALWAYIWRSSVLDETFLIACAVTLPSAALFWFIAIWLQDRLFKRDDVSA